MLVDGGDRATEPRGLDRIDTLEGVGLIVVPEGVADRIHRHQEHHGEIGPLPFEQVYGDPFVGMLGRVAGP